MTTRAATPGELARLDCVRLGLLPADALHPDRGDPDLTLLDPEGVPRARVRRDETGRAVVEHLGSGTAPTYASLRVSPGAADAAGVAVLAARPPAAGALRAAAGVRPVLLLVAAGAARADDAAHHRDVRAWRALADELGPQARLVLTPAPPDATPAERAAVATAYGVELLDLEPAPGPAAGAGAVVLLSGLSGSGKSTIAAALVAVLTEQLGRTVTLLDGDVVRTHLSKGLGFSRADRDTNVRRIGWVAAELAKHGGLVVCAPIAPYAATRAWVRDQVESQAGPGSFVLVHVATSLEECERRDRKGLYAKARAGEIPEFTGISDPYEVPTDAELVIDTVDTDPAGAAALVAEALRRSGHLEPR